MVETTDETTDRASARSVSPAPALVVAWCADASRVGEVILLEGPRAFGRGAANDDDPHPRAVLVRQRPGSTEPRPPIELPALSRVQLLLSVEKGGVRVENVGRRTLLDRDGQEARSIRLALGECAEVKGQLVLLCVTRPPELPRLRSFGDVAFAFGEADLSGFVGESPAAWAIRDQCAFVANRAAHVLVLGESGAGKEVVAQAIHARSKRGARALVSRSAATIPTGLADAELFGNLANYPNAGMPERKGLIGEADGSTLFLDELGELPEDVQSKLLRVLDERGEYQRLGETRVRRCDLRLVAATNRPISALKHDVAARFRMRLTLPGLDDRREDVALLVRHLLCRIAENDPEIGARFFDGWDGRTGTPRISPALARAAVQHRFSTHVRELDALLWRSLASSTGDTAELTAEVAGELATEPALTARRPRAEPTVEEVRAALERVGGVKERAWRELGLANRYVLKRLLEKMGASSARDED